MDLRGEVAVERAERDVRVLGHRPHLDGLEAAARGQRDRRVEDAGAAFALGIGLGQRGAGPVGGAGVTADHRALHGALGYPSERSLQHVPVRRKAAALRIALLSYRSKPHCGGQGVYVRHLSRELVDLGHEVEVFSGQPYPELDPGVRLTKVPSLDLYREPDPFRMPRLREFRDLVDVEEFLTMCTAGFPEPKTFSTRVARLLRDARRRLRRRPRQPGARLRHARHREAGAAAGHHACTTRSPSTAASTSSSRPTWRKRLSLRRWYGFLRMQGKVARQARRILTPSESSARDIARDFGVDPARMQVILLGVDDVFVPPTEPRVPGRILAMASADAPLKGISTLLEAFAKLRTERDLELLLVTRPEPGGRTEQLIDQLAIGDAVSFVSGVSDEELVG